jgi:hypothetical protein
VNAVRLTICANREVKLRAWLIQTDDLPFTHATPPMTEQAAYGNNRR